MEICAMREGLNKKRTHTVVFIRKRTELRSMLEMVCFEKGTQTCMLRRERSSVQCGGHFV